MRMGRPLGQKHRRPLVRGPSAPTDGRGTSALESFMDASALTVSEPAAWGRDEDQLDSTWWRLRSITHAPKFLRQPYVLTGYRKKLTAWEAARSAFMLHNETGAIWTHLIGAVVFIVLAVRVSLSGVVGDSANQVEASLNDTLTPSALRELFVGAPGFPLKGCLAQQSTTEGAAVTDCMADIKAWAFAAESVPSSFPMAGMLESALSTSTTGIVSDLGQRPPWHSTAWPWPGSAPLHGVNDGLRRVVQEAASRFKAEAEKVAKSALPASCASNSTATFTRCITPLETLEAAMLSANAELSRLGDRLQSAVICGDSQCYNLTAADERVQDLVAQAHHAAQVMFTEALAKAALQISFVRDAVMPNFSALRTQLAAYREEGAEQLAEQLAGQLASARMSGAAAARRLRTAVGRLLNNASKTFSRSVARGAGMGVPSIPSRMWSGFESAQSTGWARAMAAVREAEVSFAKAALDVVDGSDDIADDGSHSSTHHNIREHVWPLVAYLSSATICLGLSAVYHCFGTAMSRNMHDLFARLDFAGITTLILGSGFAVIYYTFYCRPELQQRYLTLYTAIGFPKMIACTTQWYAAPSREKLRVFNFLGLGFAGCFMVFHGMYLELMPFSSSPAASQVPQLWYSDPSAGDGSGLKGDVGSSNLPLPATVDYWESAAVEAQAEAWIFLARVLTMGVAYLSGTVLFVTHLPESRWPGRFDNCCASHQLWHVFVMVAAYILWTGLRDYAAWRISTPCSSDV